MTDAYVRNKATKEEKEYTCTPTETIERQVDEYKHLNLESLKQVFLVMDFVESDLKGIL